MMVSGASKKATIRCNKQVIYICLLDFQLLMGSTVKSQVEVGYSDRQINQPLVIRFLVQNTTWTNRIHQKPTKGCRWAETSATPFEPNKKQFTHHKPARNGLFLVLTYVLTKTSRDLWLVTWWYPRQFHRFWSCRTIGCGQTPSQQCHKGPLLHHKRCSMELQTVEIYKHSFSKDGK